MIERKLKVLLFAFFLLILTLLLSRKYYVDIRSVYIMSLADEYCTALGYNSSISFERIDNLSLVVTYCTFPDNTSCESWKFLRGQCGKKWSFCERFLNGTLIETNKSCGFDHCPICKFDNKTEFDWHLFQRYFR